MQYMASSQYGIPYTTGVMYTCIYRRTKSSSLEQSICRLIQKISEKLIVLFLTGPNVDKCDNPSEVRYILNYHERATTKIHDIQNFKIPGT